MNTATRTILNFTGVVAATVFAHWALVQIYATMCAPWSIWGPLTVFITLGSPACHFINVIQLEIAKHYVLIWVAAASSLAVWVAAKIGKSSHQD